MTHFWLRNGGFKNIGLHHKKYIAKILPLPKLYLVEFRLNTKSIMPRSGGRVHICVFMCLVRKTFKYVIHKFILFIASAASNVDFLKSCFHRTLAKAEI